METQSLTIYLQDELPRIGAGFRLVMVKLGRKWAHVFYRGRRHKVPLKKWRAIMENQPNQGQHKTGL